MRRCTLLLVALMAAGAPVASADLGRADAAFRDGQYDLAIQEAAGTRSADALALQARALLAKAMCGRGEPPTELLNDALRMADLAVAADPQHLEARLQRAISLSLLTRPMKLSDAHKSGFGEESKRLAEAVLADDPANYYARGFLSVWHVEVVRRGGTLGAMVMGASLKEARAQYAEARRLAPDDAGLHWQYARALAALGAKEHRVEIGEALHAAGAAAASTRLEEVMQARAAELQALMAAKDWTAAGDFARKTL